jgi:hypothetical protein
MTIRFGQTTTVGEIQKAFQLEFAFLKLEFFDQPHSWGESSSQLNKYAPELQLSLLEHPKVGVGYLKLHPWTKTGEAEKQFCDLFGLNVQVYRRSGHDWIETAGSDVLTLEEQNSIAKKSVEEYRDSLWVKREALL